MENWNSMQPANYEHNWYSNTFHQTIKQEPSLPTANADPNKTILTTPQPAVIYECKYCDIYFRDAVLYTIHMGYHSCDDAFKCHTCGEKCEGPVGLFVHMASNPHS